MIDIFIFFLRVTLELMTTSSPWSALKAWNFESLGAAGDCGAGVEFFVCDDFCCR